MMSKADKKCNISNNDDDNMDFRLYFNTRSECGERDEGTERCLSINVT